MTANPTTKTPEMSAESRRIVEACRRSVARALLRHKLLRQSIIVERDGEPVEVQPDDIVTGLTPEEEEEEIRTSGHGTWYSG